MIPPFDDNGYLPPGVHPATLDEIAARFGSANDERVAQMESLRGLADLAWKAGALRIVINGSFTTVKPEPMDVDCVLQFEDGRMLDRNAYYALEEGLPYITPKIAAGDEFLDYVEDLFGSDRVKIPKGTVEVIRDDAH